MVLRRTRRIIREDALTGWIVAAAILLFVATGSDAMSGAVGAFVGLNGGPDRAVTVAMILNVALILFGWQHHKKLTQQLAERTKEAEQAQYLADTDMLTGLMNRRALMNRGQKMLDEALATNREVALMLIDLDHFKTVNDHHGHSGGDNILRQAADKLIATLPEHAVKARLGGDEFVAMLDIQRGAKAAVDALANDLLTGLRDELRHNDRQISVGASLGIAMAQDAGTQMETLVRQADIAMYHCKDQGRGRQIWFENGMEMATQVRTKWEAEITAGMARGEFTPHFEPQVELATGRILGFEMLTRWESAELGHVPPERFIPMAENAGIISDLSFQVAREAMLFARCWSPDISLSLNISPLQLKDPWFSQKLAKLLVETGLPAQQLEVEITETALIDDKPLVHAIITSLRNQGVRLTLDSFGTGYASLSHLRTLPFDRIKIDRSFIAAMGHSADAKAIVLAVLRLGESLGTSIVAKGVEEASVAETLVKLGCKEAQGWHFGQTLSATEMLPYLRQRGLLRDSSAHASIPVSTAAEAPVQDSDILRRAV
jgi:diguanylate cyclase (GGDEF)-like protein